jgi:hypothetical protein
MLSLILRLPFLTSKAALKSFVISQELKSAKTFATSTFARETGIYRNPVHAWREFELSNAYQQHGGRNAVICAEVF